MLAGLLLMLAVASGAWAASEKVLYAFQGTDGNGPVNVIIGPDGALYGTTVEGGTNSCLGQGCGVVFRLARGADGEWRETVLHDFAGSDGWFPEGGLVADKAGNLYGATVHGGPNGCAGLGCGVVFELARGKAGEWAFKVLHNFALTDGAEPYAGMIFDSKGNLYGTASSGGNISACSDEGGCGVVFKLTAGGKGNWTETVAYAFDGGDGGGPMGPVIFDSSGNLYGTTLYGGANKSGTVFKLTPEGHGQWAEEVLHSFSSYTGDGDEPVYGVTFDALGNVYGTTRFGGTRGEQGWGTAFRLTPEKGGKWKETVLRSFDRAKAGGGFMSSGLIFDAEGNLYGSTGSGGKYSGGAVFKLTPRAKGSWGQTVLHSFGNGSDGSDPIGGLVFDSSGHLLGSASKGGYAEDPCELGGCGVVFEITP
jgi:uncharacterized repeat protein (TIGR03803 family)